MPNREIQRLKKPWRDYRSRGRRPIPGRVLPRANGKPLFLLALWGGLPVYRSCCHFNTKPEGLSADETPGSGCCKGTRPF
jgi:hypothetical protein